jgi:outer membrane protein assembly factor BamB
MRQTIAADRAPRPAAPASWRCLLAGAVLAGTALCALGQSATRPDAQDLPGTAAGGWREFRGDSRNTGVSHGRAPALSGVRWRFIADSEILNSPVVEAGLVYFGSRSGHVYAVRAKDGSKAWERLVAGPAGEGAPYHGFTYGGALLHAGRVYIGSEDGHLHCLSAATGEPVWRRHLGGTGEAVRLWAAPKTDGRSVFLGSGSGFLWALDPATGAERWKAWIGDHIGSTAAVFGGEVYVTSKDKRLHVVDAATGAVRWQVGIGGTSMSAPVIQLGCAFVRASGGKAVCVDLVNRSVRWTAELPASSFAQTSMAHDGERAYVTNSSTVAALADDGSPVWQYRARSAFDASPIVVGGVVIVAGTDQTLRALDKKTGAVVKELALGDPLTGTPAIVDGIAYVPGSSGILFAVE